MGAWRVDLGVVPTHTHNLHSNEAKFSLFINSAGWSSPVARQAHNLKVTGSNPDRDFEPSGLMRRSILTVRDWLIAFHARFFIHRPQHCVIDVGLENLGSRAA
jgi:hypothetical protein